jgi:hypothetical protein
MILCEVEYSTTSGATSRATCRVTSSATCRGTRTCGEGEVVDDEPARGGVVDDERRDEPRDEPRDVPRHPDAHRSRSRSLQPGEWRRVLVVHDEVDVERVRPGDE